MSIWTDLGLTKPSVTSDGAPDAVDNLEYLLKRAGHVVVVTDAVFGATGDGDTDDSSAIQDAVDSLGTGGGTVFFPIGTYKIGVDGAVVNPILIPTGVTLLGVGPKASVMKKAATDTSVALIRNANPTTFTETDITISGLGFDGSKGSATSWIDSQQLVWLTRIERLDISNCDFYDSKNDGLVIEFCKRVTVTSCSFRGNLKMGCYPSGADYVSIIGCHGFGNGSVAGIGGTFSMDSAWFSAVVACTARDDLGPSMYVGRDCQWLTVAGNHFEAIDTDNQALEAMPLEADHPDVGHIYGTGIKYGVYNSAFVGNVIRVPTKASTPVGIRLANSTHNVVSGNVISHVGRHGMMLQGASHTDVTGNVISFTGEDGIADQKNGIVVTDLDETDQAASADENWIHGNHFSDIPSGAFSIAVYKIASINPSNTVAGNKIGPNRLDIDGTIYVSNTTINEDRETVGFGRATLIGGVAAVSAPTLVANDDIRLVRQTPGGTLGHLSVTARTDGSGFTIGSASASETSTVYWEIVRGYAHP